VVRVAGGVATMPECAAAREAREAVQNFVRYTALVQVACLLR